MIAHMPLLLFSRKRQVSLGNAFDLRAEYLRTSNDNMSMVSDEGGEASSSIRLAFVSL